jgi:hypothetical protein
MSFKMLIPMQYHIIKTFCFKLNQSSLNVPLARMGSWQLWFEWDPMCFCTLLNTVNLFLIECCLDLAGNIKITHQFPNSYESKLYHARIMSCRAMHAPNQNLLERILFSQYTNITRGKIMFYTHYIYRIELYKS